jgi:hypothetical protein
MAQDASKSNGVQIAGQGQPACAQRLSICRLFEPRHLGCHGVLKLPHNFYSHNKGSTPFPKLGKKFFYLFHPPIQG